MLIDEEGKYELAAYDRIDGVAGGSDKVTAYVFERKGKSYVVCWHNESEGYLTLPLSAEQITYEEEIGGEKAECIDLGNSVKLAVAGRRYISSNLTKNEMIALLQNATLTEK